MHTLVTLIVANYNYGNYVSRAIRSCLNQSIADHIEVVVIDDCSTDNSKNVIDNFGDRINNLDVVTDKTVVIRVEGNDL